MQSVSLAAALLASAHLVLSGCSSEGAEVTSEQQACETLKRAAIDLCLSRINLTGRYYCDPLPESPEHFRLGLRYEVAPDELVGSNLIGWFAVQKSDGRVLEEDIPEDQLVPLASGCPFESE